MAVPACTAPCAATDVMAGSALTCTPKPQSVAITDDAADNYDIWSNLGYSGTTVDSWQFNIGLKDCGVTKQTTATGDIYDYYDVWFNSGTQVGGQDIIQMGQVRFR